MATEKVGIYRNYYGPVPRDSSGKPLRRSQWPRKRAHSWVVRWFGTDGQRYSKSFKTRKEANDFAEQRQSDIRQGEADVPARVPLRGFGEMYLKIRTDLTARTRREHARTLRFLQDQLGEDRAISKITPVDARHFISWYRQRTRKGTPVSAATVNKVLRECRRIFREAVDCRFIRSNPFQGMRQEKVGQTEWHYVGPDEYRRLVDACPCLRWKGMIALAYCCGLRLGELLNLTWHDIDFEDEMLRVVRERRHGHPKIRTCEPFLCQGPSRACSPSSKLQRSWVRCTSLCMTGRGARAKGSSGRTSGEISRSSGAGQAFPLAACMTFARATAPTYPGPCPCTWSRNWPDTAISERRGSTTSRFDRNSWKRRGKRSKSRWNPESGPD